MNDSFDQINYYAPKRSSPDLLTGKMQQQFNQPKPKPDFTILESLIKIPPLLKLKPSNNPFKKPEKELLDSQLMSSLLKQNVIQQRELLMQEFQAFQTPENFPFCIPESKFPSPPPGQSNMISFQKPFLIQHQNTYRDKLSQQQINQIRQRGQFEVKSSRNWVKIPYIWKMNETLFKGIQNVQYDWDKRLGSIVGVFQDTWEMLTVDMPKQLAHIGKFPWRLITLIFGKKQMKVSYTVDYNREVAKDFWNEVMTKHYVVSKEWGSDLWDFLDTQFKARFNQEIPLIANLQEHNRIKKQKDEELNAFNARKQICRQRVDKLNNISSKFSNQWDKVSKKVFIEISNTVQQKYSQQKYKEPSRHQSEQGQIVNQTTSKQAQILEKFQEEEFSYYLNFIKKEFTANQVPINVVEAIVTLLILLHVTRKKEKVWTTNQSRRKAEVQLRVKNQNPIRSRHYTWFHQRVQETFEPIEQQLRQQFYRSFQEQDIKSKLNPKQIQVLKLWVEYTRTYKERLQRKQEQKQTLYEPFKIFTLTYMLLPTYEVIRHNPVSPTDRVYYQMPKQRDINVTTAHCYWKFLLYCVRLKVWAINAFVTLVYMCWSGPVGLRCLCGIDDFSYDQYVNSESGVVTDVTRKTVLGHFVTVLEGITNSRENFQALPDTGIFGKNCSRICNLLECYVFRFFIVGVLVILTLQPIAIILVSALSFLLLITIWAWIPLAIIGTFFFSILIYNADNTEQHYECYHNLFPLFVLIVRWIFSIVKVFFYITAFFIFMPLLSMIIFVYACICRCMRSISDKFVLCFLGCCGHVPSTNSMFATKISGPDMATQFFMSINEEDVYYLIQSQLEQIHLKQIETLIYQKLSTPIQKYKKIMRLIVQPLISYQKNAYGSSSDSYLFSNIYSNPIAKSVEFAKRLATQKYSQHYKRYPKRPSNVRFTQQELNLYFDNTQQIVKTYVNKHRLNRWIFAVFDLQQGDFQGLTRKIWIDIFQCGQQIFEPLESIQERFRLEDQYQDQYQYSYSALRVDVGKVINAIKGETDLKAKKVAIISPINTSLFNQRYQIVKVPELLDMRTYNSETNVIFYQQSPSFIFAPHLSIKELFKYDDQVYTKLREQNRRNSQQW